jgi:hypothetical protein
VPSTDDAQSNCPGNGTRFVWYTGGAQHVEAGFVAVNQREFRGRGEFAERGRDAADIVGASLRESRGHGAGTVRLRSNDSSQRTQRQLQCRTKVLRGWLRSFLFQ